MAQLDSGNGPVELTGDSVGKAVSEAKVKGTGNDLSLDLKYADTKAGAYPALLVTYEIACSKGLAADKTAIVKDFLTYFSSTDDAGQAGGSRVRATSKRSAVESHRPRSQRSSSHLPQRAGHRGDAAAMTRRPIHAPNRKTHGSDRHGCDREGRT